MIAAAISAPIGRVIWRFVTPAKRSLLMAPVRRPARSCSASYRMIESALRKTRCLAFTPPGVLAFSASRSVTIPPPHAVEHLSDANSTVDQPQWRARPRNNLSVRPGAPQYVPTMPLMIADSSVLTDQLICFVVLSKTGLGRSLRRLGLHLETRVLVTGGAGFLGSHLCEPLAQSRALISSASTIISPEHVVTSRACSIIMVLKSSGMT